MARNFLLDSGAYGAWTRDATIDIEKYTTFCEGYTDASYFVNLDVIPKSIRDKRIKNDVEECCKQGWKNYKRMIRSLPMERVLPVFHKNENPKWLEKYLELGCPYVGLGGLVGSTASECIQSIKRVKHLLFDGAGRPIVKIHGFGVTSFTVMSYWDWHSVDSTSWLVTANLGGVYIPRTTGNEYDYSKPPIVLAFSPKSPLLDKRGIHIDNMTPYMKERVLCYLAENGFVVGCTREEKVRVGYKLNRGKEVWADKKKSKVIRTIEKGLATSYDLRRELNARFIKQANRVLSVKNIYFAGNLSGADHPIERKLTNRLMSYLDIESEKKSKEVFEYHMGLIRR